MPALLNFLIKLSCSLGLIWLFYRLVLHNLTFYTLNRWYLLGYTLLSFLIPFVDIGPIRGEDPALQPLIIQYIPVIDHPLPATLAPIASQATQGNTWNVLLLLLVGGSCFLLLRFLVRCISLRALRRRAVLLQEGPISIYRVPEPISPFSFGNAIYINAGVHSEKEWEEIILHEYVHIRQRHTLDILFGELLVIVNWYNPFAWVIRYSIRQNLEFIADRAVVENGIDKKGYQYHLLQVVGQTRYKLANNFNFSSLKKRIIMMNKLRSARLHLIRFLFILPLLAVLLVAFRDRLPALHSRKDLFVNAVGIVIRLSDRTPVPNVVVREQISGLNTLTDANGYYKLRIPVRGDSVSIHLDYTRPGYESSLRQRFWPSLKQTTGMCDVGTLSQPSVSANGVFVIAPDLTGTLPADPGYEDALKELHRVIKDNDDLNKYMATEKAHPEIALWYITEDKQKRILVHTDGTAERYGYPGTPSLADMDAKYGTLPDFMVKNIHPVNSGYLSRWATISAQAEKDFHPAKGNAKAIIFPGDSRVIAVTADGKARFYDMDNNDPNERTEFEELYGPLPNCVPPGYPYAPQPPNPSRPVSSLRPANTPDTGKPTKIVIHGNSPDTAPDPKKALYVIDGVIRGNGSLDDNSVQPSDIASMTILKGDEATRIFGARGANGVIAIITKSNQTNPPRIVIDGAAAPGLAPLYVVDGLPAQGDPLRNLDPGDIESISVLKPEAAKAVYGEKGSNGVVMIQTKKASRPHVVLDAKDANGNLIKIIADSFHTPEGNIHAENPKPNQ
jgi:TonB-dependent SusC/RagA subfamily outer membrane receptor